MRSGASASTSGCRARTMRPMQGGAPTRRQRAALRISAAAAAATVVDADVAAVDAACRAADAAGGFFAPPLTRTPARLLRRGMPFLTLQAGALPVQPRSLEHALDLYGSYTSKYCSVRVENVHVRLQSWEQAVAALRSAEAAAQPYWCSLIEGVQHPGWWPEGGHVPTYDQVIFGRGNASIGLHFDKDNGCANGTRRPVATYLAASAGAKLVLLLPPEQTLLPAPGGDAAQLLRPTAAFLDAVRDAGGHYFLLRPDERTGSAAALYMPAGWYHWVVGLTDWHVVYGGSYYPEQQAWCQQ